jgi:hypothetical protein
MEEEEGGGSRGRRTGARGRGRGLGRRYELDVGGCEDLTVVPRSSVHGATDVRKWERNAAAVGVELFESSLISRYRMQFGE